MNGSCGWYGYYHNRKAGKNIEEYILNYTKQEINDNIYESSLINELKVFTTRKRLEKEIQYEERAEYGARAVQETAEQKTYREVTEAVGKKYGI